MEYLSGLSWDLPCLTSLSVTCRRSCTACFSSLQATPNWGTSRYAQGQNCHPVGSAQRVGNLTKFNLTVETLQNSTGTNARSCTWWGEEPCATIQAEQWGSSSVEKDLGSLVDIRQQHGVSAKKANDVLELSSRLRGVTIPLHSAFVRPQLHPLLGPPV